MNKTFRPWDVEQRHLFPPSVRDFVPEGHLAHFVREMVREDLDLSAIFAAYTEARGYPPYHPAMMTRCCCTGTARASTPRGGWRRRAKSVWTSWR